MAGWRPPSFAIPRQRLFADALAEDLRYQMKRHKLSTYPHLSTARKSDALAQCREQTPPYSTLCPFAPASRSTESCIGAGPAFAPQECAPVSRPIKPLTRLTSVTRVVESGRRLAVVGLNGCALTTSWEGKTRYAGEPQTPRENRGPETNATQWTHRRLARHTEPGRLGRLYRDRHEVQKAHPCRQCVGAKGQVFTRPPPEPLEEGGGEVAKG